VIASLAASVLLACGLVILGALIGQTPKGDGRKVDGRVKNATATDGMWAHEFNSLSTDSLVGTRRGRPSWYPNRPGLEYHRLDDVPEQPRPRRSMPGRCAPSWGTSAPPAISRAVSPAQGFAFDASAASIKPS
jgi:hypothetical protein